MKIKEKNKKIIANLILFICFLIITSGYMFFQLLSNLDEIWVYNFSKCILDGLLPYKNISMIITPLFPYIGAILLKIFGNEIIVFRFFECLK